jgi:RNA polymerase sigma-70 factor (ECF subfamily)
MNARSAAQGLATPSPLAHHVGMSEETDRPSPELLLTTELLRRAKDGDPAALETLTARYLPRLARWASGRLPWHARSLFDTSDLVQETLLKAIQGLDGIEVRGPGGFQAYVRQAVLNRIRDQMRWAKRRPGREEVPESLADRTPSPLESAIGADVLMRYEQAMETLSEEERQLLHLRIELDFGYEEIAAMTDRKSKDAARMAVQRALKKLAETMGHAR